MTAGFSPQAAFICLRRNRKDLAAKIFGLLGLSLWASVVGAQTYYWSTLAGNSGYGFADGPGSNALFWAPCGVATDSSGNVYVADAQNNLIRLVTPDGVVTTFAGTPDVTGTNDGAGSAAQFHFPQGIALDSSNNVYVADTANNTIRKITPGGVVTTFAGTPGTTGSTDSAQGSPLFQGPAAVAVDGSNNIYVADTGNHTIRFITPAGIVSTLAGTAGKHGSADGVGSAASFYMPFGLTVDNSGNVYVADTFNDLIRMIAPGGTVTTLAGQQGMGNYQDGTGTNALFHWPYGIAWNGADELYVGDSQHNAIRQINLSTRAVTFFAGSGYHIFSTFYCCNPGAIDGANTNASFYSPQGLAVSPSGAVFVADTGNDLIRQITIANGATNVTTLAGTGDFGGSADGTGSAARFNNPNRLALDSSNNIYVSDSGNNTIRKVTLAGVVTTLAGTAGVSGHADGANGAASFNYPTGLAVDSSNNVFVSDSRNYTIRKITPAGVVTTFAGTAGVSGTNDGVGAAAQFKNPLGLAIDIVNNIYVADAEANTIRMITPVGVVSTFAGTGVAGDVNGAADVAEFNQPTDVALDDSGNIYVMDSGNLQIREITGDPMVSTWFNWTGGYSPSGLFWTPLGCFGEITFLSAGYGTIYQVTSGGTLTTIGGTPFSGGDASGDGTAAGFYNPNSVVLVPSGTLKGVLVVADGGNQRLCLGTPSCGQTQPPPPPSNPGNSHANNLNEGTTLCPISTRTGELYEPMAPDISLGGPMPLVFQRYYASLIQSDGYITGHLGENWLHNFEMALTVTSSNVVQVVNQFGRVIQFTNSSGAFTLIGRQDVPYQLAGNGSGYVMGDPWSKLLYTFSSDGALTQIADGHGNVQTLSYSGNLLTNVRDGLGRFLDFQYNADEQLTNVSDGARSIGFVQTGSLLTSSSDALGNVTTYTYAANTAMSGLLTAITLPAGNQPFTQVFNSSGQVVTQVVAGALPGTNTLLYSAGSTSMTDPLGNETIQTNNAAGQLTGLVDEAGFATTMTYNEVGQRTSITDRLGRTSQTTWHGPSGQLASVTLPDGTVTTSTYTNRSVSGITFYDLSQVAYPDGTSDNFTYDANGNVLSHTDRAGQTWTFTYNGHGQILTATDPANGMATFTYNADGTVASRQDTDTRVTTFGYDSLRRLTNVVHPDGSNLGTAYDADDRVTSTTDELGHTYNYAYDADSDLTRISDPLGQKTRLAYDAASRLIQITDPLGATAAIGYDAGGNVFSNSTPTGDVTLFSYDARRRLTSITDPAANVWTRGYDNEARLLSAANPMGQTRAFQRNALGNVVSASDALNNTVNDTRDLLQRVTLLLDPLSRSNTFAYDPHDALSAAGKQGIGTAAYRRNSLGLLSRIADLNSNAWSFAYTPMGRLTTRTDPLSRATSYAYDSRGRLEQTTFADGTACSNILDPANNLLGLAYSAGPNLAFAYDARNRLISAQDLGLAYDADSRVTNTVSSGLNFGAAYDASGRLTSVSYNNSTFTVNYSYDHRGLLTNVTDTLSGAQVGLQFDAAGRLIGMTRANGVNGTYTYDDASRLTGIQEGSIVNLQFTLDAAGEIISNAITAPLDPTTAAAPQWENLVYDAASQTDTHGYAFDLRGRQTAAPGHNFNWDGASRLTGIDSVTLGYNGLGQIETRAQNGVTEHYFYNHAIRLAPIVAERNDSTGQFVRYYVWTPGGRLLYYIDAGNGNAVYYYHFDQVGSTLALTTAGGSVSDAYAYSPYGVLLGHNGGSTQPFTYIGEFGVRSEAAGNLYDMRARYYDPGSARFLSRDPIWPRLGQPDALNPYQYASRNPASHNDPMGMLDAEPNFDDWVDFFYGDDYYSFLRDFDYLIYGDGEGPPDFVLNQFRDRTREEHFTDGGIATIDSSGRDWEDFYRKTIANTPHDEWQDWRAVNVAIDQSFLDDRLVFELEFDRVPRPTPAGANGASAATVTVVEANALTTAQNVITGVSSPRICHILEVKRDLEGQAAREIFEGVANGSVSWDEAGFAWVLFETALESAAIQAAPPILAKPAESTDKPPPDEIW